MGGEDRTERREEIEGGSMGKNEGRRKEQGVRRPARSTYRRSVARSWERKGAV